MDSKVKMLPRFYAEILLKRKPLQGIINRPKAQIGPGIQYLKQQRPCKHDF